MKKLLLIALPAIALNLHAAEPARSSRTGYVEISIHDLPEGSSKNLGPAIREYIRKLDAANGDRTKIERPRYNAKAAEALVVYPKEHVYDVDNAKMERTLDKSQILNDYSSLMLEPVDLDATRACQLLGTVGNGMYNRKTGQYAGFVRVFNCPDGDVLTWDMTFYGMRRTVIREQQNVEINGIRGIMHGLRDSNGNSHTSLSWVSNDIDHQVQKIGVDAATREWLLQYARELQSKEAELKKINPDPQQELPATPESTPASPPSATAHRPAA